MALLACSPVTTSAPRITKCHKSESVDHLRYAHMASCIRTGPVASEALCKVQKKFVVLLIINGSGLTGEALHKPCL
jgi:hypothetical protein